MQELLSLETAHFSFSIWGSGIQKRQDTYSEMLKKRGQEETERPVQLRFSSPLSLKSISCLGTEITIEQKNHYTEIILPTSIFFENIQLQMDWDFKEKIEGVEVLHRLERINQGFRFVKKQALLRPFDGIKDTKKRKCFAKRLSA